jgi:hypothetical protein
MINDRQKTWSKIAKPHGRTSSKTCSTIAKTHGQKSPNTNGHTSSKNMVKHVRRFQHIKCSIKLLVAISNASTHVSTNRIILRGM